MTRTRRRITSSLALCGLQVALASGCAERALEVFDPNTPLLSDDLGGDASTRPTTMPHPPGTLPLEYCERIVVLSDSGQLSLFDPVRLTFEDTAQLACPGVAGSSAYSMALDHEGRLWVESPGGELFTADVQTGACTPTTFVVGQSGFHRFDMSFVPGAGGEDERLYIDAFRDLGQSQLGWIDPAGLKVTPVGQLNHSAELTTTGSGELWGLFRGSAPHAGRIDTQSAEVAPDFSLRSRLGDITGDGLAFSELRGSFYIFLLPHNSSTSVYRMSAADGTVEKILPKTGRSLISATVARCLP